MVERTSVSPERPRSPVNPAVEQGAVGTRPERTRDPSLGYAITTEEYPTGWTFRRDQDGSYSRAVFFVGCVQQTRDGAWERFLWRCPHAHQGPATAQRCAERYLDRLVHAKCVHACHYASASYSQDAHCRDCRVVQGRLL